MFAFNFKNTVRIMHSIRNFQGVIITPPVHGVNLTPYRRVIISKRSLKNSFSGVKITPDLELISRTAVKVTPKKGLSCT